jgi:uncharacterized protein
MLKTSREFQVFVKPIGSVCNLDCQYCYYLKKQNLYPNKESFRMPDDVLENYIIQHINATSEPVINFSWHGGEPTVLGLDYFRKIVSIQKKHTPVDRCIQNGIQTNGTLLDEEWCNFLATENFMVGISIDGPQEMHDRYRVTKNQKPTFEQTLDGYKLLQKHQVLCEILCVVNAYNVRYPSEVYHFFKQLHTKFISFLPLVEKNLNSESMVSAHTVPSEAFGDFLCTVFDEWIQQDIGQIKIQIFEEAARSAFEQEHTLCIFRKTCGGVPVIEHNGDFFSCDHYVNTQHKLGNIQNISLVELLESPEQIAFGQAKLDTLPHYCRSCEVRDMCNGGCPKNRFIRTPDGETGLNYLCAGYKKFFNHCQPFVTEIAKLWQQKTGIRQKEKAGTTKSMSKTGRNAPCPCGSGLKYKKCCWDKK